MLYTFSSINLVLNKIHYWNEPHQSPIKRIFLTRLSLCACVCLESSYLAFKNIEIAFLSTKQLTILSSKAIVNICPRITCLKLYANHPLQSDLFYNKATHIAQAIMGIASTLLVGIIFSPEMNFKIHLKLALIVDNLAEKKQRELTKKLDAEKQKEKINQARKERYSLFEAQLKASKASEEEAYRVDSRLAELL